MIPRFSFPPLLHLRRVESSKQNKNPRLVHFQGFSMLFLLPFHAHFLYPSSDIGAPSPAVHQVDINYFASSPEDNYSWIRGALKKWVREVQEIRMLFFWLHRVYLDRSCVHPAAENVLLYVPRNLNKSHRNDRPMSPDWSLDGRRRWRWFMKE